MVEEEQRACLSPDNKASLLSCSPYLAGVMAVPRIAYLAALILCVAPLASFYVITVLIPFILQMTTSSSQDSSTGGNDGKNSLSSISAESLMKLLIENRRVTFEDLMLLEEEEQTKSKTTTLLTSNHRKQVISFLVPLVLFICLFLVLCSFYFYSLFKSKYWSSKDRASKRRQRLCHHLEPYKKILQENDRVIQQQRSSTTQSNNYSNRSTIIKRRGQLKWKIPMAGIKFREDQSMHLLREIDGECAICLGQFTNKECIVWSSNVNCSHYFHYDCILSWLERRTAARRRKLCPCCRQQFIIT